MQATKRIAIIGGGPAGLTFAKILSNRGIPSEVFEYDEHPLSRPQGGSLDLHADSGQKALREAGLFEEFKRFARYDDQSSVVYDHLGKLHFHNDEQSEGDRPEIDRTQLRDILIRSLAPGSIHWGSKIREIENLGNGRHRVHGLKAPLGDFDLVVGADGAWSKVRPLLTNETPQYTGLTAFEIAVDDVDNKHPEIAQLLPKGKIAAVDKGKGVIAQRSSAGHVRGYFMFRIPQDEIKQTVDMSDSAYARSDLLKLLKDWHPSFLSLINASTSPIVARPIVVLPSFLRWQTKPGITLIGDSAHVMAPFGGQGVNMAMQDALELALQLSTQSDWNKAVMHYEQAMFERANAVAEGANEAAKTWPQHVLELIAENRQQTPQSTGVTNNDSLSPESLIRTKLVPRLEEPALLKKVNASFIFKLSGPKGGDWLLSFKPKNPLIRKAEAEDKADCTISMSDENFVLMMTGAVSPRMAFMKNLLKLDGDMFAAMKLGPIISE